MTNTNTRRTLTVAYSLDGENKLREASVAITDGYSTVADIPRILAVKHYSSNEPFHIAKVNVFHTCSDTGARTCARCLMLAAGAGGTPTGLAPAEIADRPFVDVWCGSCGMLAGRRAVEPADVVLCATCSSAGWTTTRDGLVFRVAR
jgi:hypothetical protein